MFNYYPVPKNQSLFIITGCIIIMLICFHLRPMTYQGKTTVGGLFGFVVGIAIALVKTIFD